MGKQAKFETTCPACGEKVVVVAGEGDVAGHTVTVAGKCQRCLNAFEATSELDCLEWDDQCTLEIGRLA